MSHEIEVKFKAADFSAVRRALRRAGAKYVGTVVQTDSYYDTSDRMLLARDCGLRIRKVRCLRSAAGGIDTRPLLTAKGPSRGRGAKVRREVQTHLDDPEAVMDIFRSMGLRPALSVQKRRSTYRLGSSTVELDELPIIGRFVEIESPDLKTLDRICRRLGLEGPRITDHYVNLLAKATGLPPGRRDFRLTEGGES